MTDAYIFDAIRTPRGKGRDGGSLQELSAVRLSALVLNQIKQRSELAANGIDDVIWGVGTQVFEQGGGLGRAAVLASDFAPEVPALTINRFCASSLEAANLAAMQVRAGIGEGYIAGGVEMASRVAQGSDGSPMAVDPLIAMKHFFVPQGIAADVLATEFGITRKKCDRYAVESHKRAARAWSEKRFDRAVMRVEDQNGVTILDQDETVRDDTSLEVMRGLEPSFKAMGEKNPAFDKVAVLRFPHLEKIDHVHHPGNSSTPVDGAAAVLIGSKAFGARHGLTPRARILSMAKAGGPLTMMLGGAVPATTKALDQAGLSFDRVDLFEINELYASVALHFMRSFEANPAKVNVNGGSIAMGHPMGAAGGVMLSSLLEEMERGDHSIGLAATGAVSGMGAATVLERV